MQNRRSVASSSFLHAGSAFLIIHSSASGGAGGGASPARDCFGSYFLYMLQDSQFWWTGCGHPGCGCCLQHNDSLRAELTSCCLPHGVQAEGLAWRRLHDQISLTLAMDFLNLNVIAARLNMCSLYFTTKQWIFMNKNACVAVPYPLVISLVALCCLLYSKPPREGATRS
jgi:hypothetical protein